MRQHIEQKLFTALSPNILTVIDDSDKHIGHAGAREGGQTHFSVEIVSIDFKGLSKIKSHQMIYNILADEMAGDNAIHALAIKASAS